MVRAGGHSFFRDGGIRGVDLVARWGAKTFTESSEAFKALYASGVGVPR